MIVNPRWLAGFALALGLAATGAQAQTAQPAGKLPGPEIFVSFGRAQKQAPAETNPYNAEANVGAGVTLAVRRRLAAEFEINRILDVSRDSLQYQSVLGQGRIRPDGSLETIVSNVPFVAHAGVTSMTSGSGNLIYYFSGGVLQPYLSGGMGLVSTNVITSNASLRMRDGAYYAEVVERESRNSTIGPTLGGGLRILIASRIVIRPEFRLYGVRGASRGSIAVGYQWQ